MKVWRWPLFAMAAICLGTGVGLFVQTDTGRDEAAAFLLGVGGVLLGAGLVLYVLSDH
jgi:ABC-type xylose transport system permease subunit